MGTPPRMIEKPDLVVYHASCDDGFGAAFAVHQKCAVEAWPQPDFVPWNYNRPLSEFPVPFKDKKILMLDFSMPREDLQQVHHEAALLQVIDHHKTAEERLQDLDYCYFDMSKSGAVLAWESAFPGGVVPLLLQYVQDRDLWVWELEGSREVSAVIRSYPREFSHWYALSLVLEDSPKSIIREGRGILRFKEILVNTVAGNAEEWHFCGHQVPGVACPVAQLTSEVGEKLREGRSFSASYFTDQNGDCTWSLRSAEDGSDVAAIAKEYGGGGHKHAAGFKVSSITDSVRHPLRLCSYFKCSLNE